MTTITQRICEIIHTASARDTVYAVTEDGRVLVRSRDGWGAVGILVGTVRLGMELRFVTDDILTITSPVIEIEDRTHQAA